MPITSTAGIVREGDYESWQDEIRYFDEHDDVDAGNAVQIRDALENAMVEIRQLRAALIGAINGLPRP